MNLFCQRLNCVKMKTVAIILKQLKLHLQNDLKSNSQIDSADFIICNQSTLLKYVQAPAYGNYYATEPDRTIQHFLLKKILLKWCKWYYFSYLYFMPVLMLWSLEEGTLWTDSCPRLLATMATALNLLRVPVLGLLAFCRLSLSSVLRLMDRWSVQTNDTCILSQRMHGYHRKKFNEREQTQ